MKPGLPKPRSLTKVYGIPNADHSSIKSFVDEALVSGAFARDPHRMYRRLRDEAPVFWSDHLQQWLVTSYERVEEVLLQPRRFSSFGFDAAFIGRLGVSDSDDVSTLAHHFNQRGLIQADPPEHTTLRRALSGQFTARAVAPLSSTIRSIVEALLDEAGSEFDAIRDPARPLPVAVIAGLLGVPEVDRSRFPTWSDDTVRFFGTPAPDLSNARRLNEDLISWRALLVRLLDERRVVLRDDLLGKIASLIEAGEITLEEALFTAVHLLIAGHETTTNLTGNTLYLLLSHPEQVRQAWESPALLANAIEETLRFEPPIQRVRRVATEPCELGGKTIEAGDPVIPVLSAANRDASRFPRPDEFDIGRDSATGPARVVRSGCALLHWCPSRTAGGTGCRRRSSGAVPRRHAARRVHATVENHHQPPRAYSPSGSPRARALRSTMSRQLRTGGDVRVEISDDCVGSGQCLVVASDVFRADDEGYATFRVGELENRDWPRCATAVDACPTGAIRIVDSEFPAQPSQLR